MIVTLNDGSVIEGIDTTQEGKTNGGRSYQMTWFIKNPSILPDSLEPKLTSENLSKFTVSGSDGGYSCEYTKYTQLVRVMKRASDREVVLEVVLADADFNESVN